MLSILTTPGAAARTQGLDSRLPLLHPHRHRPLWPFSISCNLPLTAHSPPLGAKSSCPSAAQIPLAARHQASELLYQFQLETSTFPDPKAICPVSVPATSVPAPAESYPGPLGQTDTQKNTNAHGSRPPGTGAHATAKDAGKAFAAGNRRPPPG